MKVQKKNKILESGYESKGNDDEKERDGKKGEGEKEERK